VMSSADTDTKDSPGFANPRSGRSHWLFLPELAWELGPWEAGMAEEMMARSSALGPGPVGRAALGAEGGKEGLAPSGKEPGAWT